MKAQELVDKFNIDIEPFSEYGKWDEYLAKKCALIAVDEKISTLLDVIGSERHMYSSHELDLFKELHQVKTEIEQL